MGPGHRETSGVDGPRDRHGLEEVLRQEPDTPATPGWRRLRQVDDYRFDL